MQTAFKANSRTTNKRCGKGVEPKIVCQCTIGSGFTSTIQTFKEVAEENYTSYLKFNVEGRHKRRRHGTSE